MGTGQISVSAGVQRNTAILGLAALLLMLLGGFLYREWRQYNRANTDGARSREIDAAVGMLRTTLIDAETGQRGFLLTGEPRYLEPYDQAVQAIPGQLAKVRSLFVTRQGETAQVTRLNDLVGQKLAELYQTIELYRTHGSASALALVLSDRGKWSMDEIRALCAEIQRSENSFQNQASIDREAATRTALLMTVTCSLVLLFFFAVGLEPFSNAQANRRTPWPFGYGAAIIAPAAATVLRMALTPLIGTTAIPYVMFFPAVLFAAWFGGVRVGSLSLLLSALAADYYFIAPIGAFGVSNHGDQIGLLIFVVAGFGAVLLSQSQRNAVGQADQAKHSEREHRQRLQTTLASIGDAVISTDAEGRVVFINDVAQRLLRASDNDVIGRPLEDVFRIVDEFTRARVEIAVTKVLRYGATFGLANHTLLLARDGAETPIDDSFAPIRAGNEPIQGAVLVFRDISERRRAEATNRLLASIVESSTDGIYSYDLNGMVTSWNRGAERIFGYSAEEMIGRPVSNIMVPGHVNETDLLERVQKGERIEQYDTVRRAKNGQLINVSVTLSPIQDALGRVTGASKVARDITERKLAEERFRLALEAAPNGMVVAEEDGKILLVNSAMERLFGYSRQELIGQPVELLVPHRFRDQHRRNRERFNSDPRPRLMGEGRDLLAQRKDGSEFPVHTSLSPIETGQNRWVLSAVVDMTERKRVEQERFELMAKERALASERALREMEEELARVARGLAVGELATSIAHEVNQPLAGVVTNAEAGLRWLAGEAPALLEARESLKLIVRDGNRASDIIRRIREFLKKGSQHLAPLDVNDVIQESAALARGELLKREANLRMELSGGLPPVLADRIQLQQVLLNLIMNGCEAMASSSGSRELLVTSRESAGAAAAPCVHVAVRDCGVCIKPEDRNRIFDAFFTTKTAGMGMGLSISRSIIEAHGGQIWAEANDGPGLVVQFRLPVAAANHE
jgi:PAS domain S-box-containing protein